MVFSYILGDNFLYRIAVHLFIGAAAGYITIVSIESVLIPWIQQTLIGGFDNPNFLIGMIPIIIGVLLLFKISPRYSRFGNIGLAVVMGVGTAVALWGAVAGTLIPVAGGVARSFTPGNAIDGFILLFGTIAVLVYFTYVGRRRPSGAVVQPLPIRTVGLIGRGVVVITLGATYALVILSALTVFTGVLVNRLLILRGG
jgi:hypothetical protein